MREQSPDNLRTDLGLLSRIRGIAFLNAAIGSAEFAAGLATNSSTLTMAGVHDLSDAGLYELKHQAAKEHDHARKQRLRRVGAGALVGAALSIGGYEIAHAASGDHQPEPTAAVIGIIAAGANIAAAGTMHSRRHSHNAQDTWKHIAGVDVPASLITLVVTPLSVRYPELDVVGAAAHMTLATSIGFRTFRSISQTD